jgi:hypothetical protein
MQPSPPSRHYPHDHALLFPTTAHSTAPCDAGGRPRPDAASLAAGRPRPDAASLAAGRPRPDAASLAAGRPRPGPASLAASNPSASPHRRQALARPRLPRRRQGLAQPCLPHRRAPVRPRLPRRWKSPPRISVLLAKTPTGPHLLRRLQGSHPHRGRDGAPSGSVNEHRGVLQRRGWLLPFFLLPSLSPTSTGSNSNVCCCVVSLSPGAHVHCGVAAPLSRALSHVMLRLDAGSLNRT